MFMLKLCCSAVTHHHATKSVRNMQTFHIVLYEIFMLALQQMSMAAAAPPLQVASSAPVKFLYLCTKSVKAVDAVSPRQAVTFPGI